MGFKANSKCDCQGNLKFAAWVDSTVHLLKKSWSWHIFSQTKENKIYLKNVIILTVWSCFLVCNKRSINAKPLSNHSIVKGDAIQVGIKEGGNSRRVLARHIPFRKLVFVAKHCTKLFGYSGRGIYGTILTVLFATWKVRYMLLVLILNLVKHYSQKYFFTYWLKPPRQSHWLFLPNQWLQRAKDPFHSHQPILELCQLQRHSKSSYHMNLQRLSRHHMLLDPNLLDLHIYAKSNFHF